MHIWTTLGLMPREGLYVFLPYDTMISFFVSEPD